MTENNTPNPLAKHFRQPSIYIKLPSDGAFYDDSVVEFPHNKELPVYPMTALDEIAYRTADALFNGAAVANVIKSCLPAFKDPWQISIADLDTILIAIRIASYGHEMNFLSKCPKCEEENEFAIDLRTVMESIKFADYSQTVVIGDIQIHFKPLTYKEQNENNTAQFEDQKLMESLPQTEMPEDEKLKLLQKAFQNISFLTLTAIADSISMIKTGDQIVVDKKHIEEYIQNCDGVTFEKIRKRIEDIRTSSEIKPMTITCNDCKNQYETPFTMNVANFFE